MASLTRAITGRRYQVKGGVGAFKGMMDALADGWNMALTADVPKVPRVAGLGIIKLASATGRPIFPVALATSRRIVLDSWDRSARLTVQQRTKSHESVRMRGRTAGSIAVK